MNRAFLKLLAFIFFLSASLPAICLAQSDDQQVLLSPQDLEIYKSQTEQLVRFMEFAFNTLGNPDVSTREKDIIINQSYLKFFASGKVQIEDDLVEGRFTVTNKDVQAYLKDIDFFFENVEFTFNIEEISYNVNDKGQVFFIVTTTRTISGIGVEGDTIYNNQQRFIEVNLDRNERDLKIASIYTSKLSEKEDMRNWWASLSAGWRLFFAKGIMINNVYPLKDVLGFEEDRVFIERFQVTVIEGYILESRRPDTIDANPQQIYTEIARLWKTESIDITAFPFILDLSPLSKLSELRTINISGAWVDDLTPIRNLTHLENLIISNSQVSTLDPLRYSINLKNLDVSHTAISDLSPLPAFPSLERLNLSESSVTDITPVSSLPKLSDLRFANTSVHDLSPLANTITLNVIDISNTPVTRLDSLSKLQTLERLHADNIAITDLSPLENLTNLQYIFLEGSDISDIQILSGLPSLKRIYCDRTRITREQANRFMQENPDVLVIYESQALTTWWAGLPPNWIKVFSTIVSFSNPPTREELHEIANITHIDISGNREILSLAPLRQLLGLRSLRASNSGIFSIDPLKENIDLEELDISSTGIYDISVIVNLRILERLNLNNTPVRDISVLKENHRLRFLDLEGTEVSSLESLTLVSNLDIVFCDGLETEHEEISRIYDANPNVTIVYQTENLNAWWESLSQAWKDVFMNQILMESQPARLQLQRLVDLPELDISNLRGLDKLKPLKPFHRLLVLKMNDVQIGDLNPLANLTKLRELYLSNNPVSSLEPIANLSELLILDCSNTQVRNLNDISNLYNLQVLNISGTQVRNLRPLRDFHTLRQLDCFNTRIRSLRPLENLENLELLRCYNTPLWPWALKRFQEAQPGCEVVYY
jgi:Leucine-rich repeat (LRR) protein